MFRFSSAEKLLTAKIAEKIRRDRRAIAKPLFFLASSAAFLSELRGQRLLPEQSLIIEATLDFRE